MYLAYQILLITTVSELHRKFPNWDIKIPEQPIEERRGHIQDAASALDLDHSARSTTTAGDTSPSGPAV